MSASSVRRPRVAPHVVRGVGLPLHRLDPIERGVVEAAVYADIFDWPLTPAELHRYLPVPARLEEVEAALAGLRRSGLVRSIDGMVTIEGREHLVAERRRRATASARLWSRAGRYAQVVASLPFVRFVAVTGSLAVGAAGEGADVDLFVITEDHRLWLTRALTMVVVRAAAVRGVALCPNYVLAESALEMPERDIFTAHELVQMIPLAGGDAHRALVERNGWYRQFLPNHPGPPQPGRSGGDRMVKRAAEHALRTSAIDRVERWEMERKIARLTAGVTSTEARFDEWTCKGHVDGHRHRALTAFRERLAGLGQEAA